MEEHPELTALKAQHPCPKDHCCLDFENTRLCKAKYTGIKGYAECLERKPYLCSHALSFGYGYLCRCQVRVHLAEHRGR